MNNGLKSIGAVVVMALTFVLRSNAAVPTDYAGKPFQDDAQLIPGRVECAYFDLGG